MAQLDCIDLFGDATEMQAHTDQVMSALARYGAFQVPLPGFFAELNAKAFAVSKAFLELPDELKNARAIAPRSTELNGYHGPGGLSSYNKYRSGFIFEDPHIPDLLNDGQGTFPAVITQWRDEVKKLANRVLGLIAGGLEIDAAYFSEGGPLNSVSNLQFHVKSFHPADPGTEKVTEGDRIVRMFAHRDPSSITILLHDGPQDTHPGQGLQLLDEKGDGGYFDVQRTGWDIATVMSGNVMARVTRGVVHSAKHRVSTSLDRMHQSRIAATFFFQPIKSSPLACVPSSVVPDTPHGHCNHKETYGEWKHRAYAKYYRGQGS